jgi:hypothetical protein
VRLLETLANSMSVALESARLFDETQRLFKAEQERVAELQIINSIQQGLAAFSKPLWIWSAISCGRCSRQKILVRWYDEKSPGFMNMNR